MFSERPDTFIGKRIKATIIDYTVIFSLTIFYYYMVSHQTPAYEINVSGLEVYVPILFWFLYFVVCENFLDGTLGHQMLKIKVVTTKGSKPNFGQTLTRRLCDAIEISWCFGIIAILIAIKNNTSQRLGDILADTIVVGEDTVIVNN
ncbi:MAG: RDD family protein [Chitinophagaceae bacterium]|jgi:uncharacterized RDD family membrane protein YckC|nr:MAG: RDD family protein [Chitinophagaceae bacterium]